ncbi:MAG: hypothetical protein ABI824_01880 [Acidobacteriota bacterium]
MRGTILWLTLMIEQVLEQAGQWFLNSGIQEPSGGVARYYQADLGRNLPISNEITGYAASAFSFLYERTGDARYSEAAVKTARFLTDRAWDNESSTFPFEPASNLGYFFDLGIIARGLLAVSRVTSSEEFRSRAQDAALSLAFDYLGDAVFHPVILLPEKQPLPYEPRWSREPGCFQLKSALAWREVDDPHARRMFDTALALALATHHRFLPSVHETAESRARTMDRLHAYCYFLEALLSATEHEEARVALNEGIARVAALLRSIAPEFERSDVCAQLLRVRLIAHHLGVVSLDADAAADEASRVASHQALNSGDIPTEGGFWFGTKAGQILPYSNPVSTAFCLQALTLWDDHQQGNWRFELAQLI